MGTIDMNNRITITMPYYDAPLMLKEHLENWCTYPANLADKISVVLVDDGSQKYPAAEVLKSEQLPVIPIHLYRVLENIPWNHGGARNLGMHNVPDGWVLSTDIDHILTAPNFERLLSKQLDSSKSYRLGRMRQNLKGKLESMKPHRESFLMTKSMFWGIGGFDEDFNGYWNGVFYPFLRNVRLVCSVIELNDVTLLFRDDCTDATVKDWGRIGSQWDINIDAPMRKKQHAAAKNYKPKNPLRFEWEKVI